MVLWDYCIQRRAKIHNVIPCKLFQNDGLTPYTAIFRAQDFTKFLFVDWEDTVVAVVNPFIEAKVTDV